MKGIRISIVIIIIVLLSACDVFLGSDPDHTPGGILYSLWSDFNETYGPMDSREKNLDFIWKDVYKDFSSKVEPQWKPDGIYLFDLCGKMLLTLQDAHVNLSSPVFGSSISSDYSAPVFNFFYDFNFVRKYLLNSGIFAGEGLFLYGIFRTRPNIGYIQIRDFILGDDDFGFNNYLEDWVADINGIIQALKDTDTIILDIRGNLGGLPQNGEYIAGRFASVQKDYIKVSTKSGPGRNDFSSPVTFTVKPSGQGTYTKPIVLLTNEQTMSAGELFTLAMRTQNHVIHVGTTATRGSLSGYMVRPLINGWHYSIPFQRITDMNENCYEGKGIFPQEIAEISFVRDEDLLLIFARDFAANLAR